MTKQSYAAMMANAWNRAANFNLIASIGDTIKCKSDVGTLFDVTTVSEAFALPDGSVHVMIRTLSGNNIFQKNIDVLSPS
jgi:hypothetical protein